MNALNKIKKKDPLHVADDDHPERKDISKKEFDEACRNLKTKYGMKKAKDRDKKGPFSKGTIDALNSVKSQF